MRVYRRYRCDFAHEWTITAPEGEAERRADTICPEGHEAVTCHKELPADEVQILFRPAARIVDRATGEVWHQGRYFIVMLDRADRELRASKEHYTWDEALHLAAVFRGKDEARALELWSRRAL